LKSLDFEARVRFDIACVNFGKKKMKKKKVFWKNCFFWKEKKVKAQKSETETP
jgi:hypothetical protein